MCKRFCADFISKNCLSVWYGIDDLKKNEQVFLHLTNIE